MVDDNPASLYSTSRILRSAGFEVIEATTGAEALAAAEQDIGLIVLDINLPDIDGLEVCRRLRARTNTAYLPIIHLTATFVASDDMAAGPLGRRRQLPHAPGGSAGADRHGARAAVRAPGRRAQAHHRRALPHHLRTGLERHRAAGPRSGIPRRESGVLPARGPRARASIIGKHCIDLIAPGHEEICEQLHRSLADGGRWEGTLPVARPDGSVAEVEWRIVAENSHGVRIAIATNVTEREKLLASERAARTEAERSNRLKDEFLATLSHELRNPLNAMLGWASVLKRKNVTPAMLEQGLDAIERNSRVQSHLIEDLLDFAGIRFGKMRVDVDAIPPARAVESAAEVVQTQASNKGVELHLHVSDREAHVLADESRLQQVVWNLLSNAIKFTPTGGRIDVHARVSTARIRDRGDRHRPRHQRRIPAADLRALQPAGIRHRQEFRGTGDRPHHRQAPGRHPPRHHRRGQRGRRQGRDLSRAPAADRTPAQRSDRRTRARACSACACWWSRTIRMRAR